MAINVKSLFNLLLKVKVCWNLFFLNELPFFYISCIEIFFYNTMNQNSQKTSANRIREPMTFLPFPQDPPVMGLGLQD